MLNQGKKTVIFGVEHGDPDARRTISDILASNPIRAKRFVIEVNSNFQRQVDQFSQDGDRSRIGEILVVARRDLFRGGRLQGEYLSLERYLESARKGGFTEVVLADCPYKLEGGELRTGKPTERNRKMAQAFLEPVDWERIRRIPDQEIHDTNMRRQSLSFEDFGLSAPIRTEDLTIGVLGDGHARMSAKFRRSSNDNLTAGCWVESLSGGEAAVIGLRPPWFPLEMAKEGSLLSRLKVGSGHRFFLTGDAGYPDKESDYGYLKDDYTALRW